MFLLHFTHLFHVDYVFARWVKQQIIVPLVSSNFLEFSQCIHVATEIEVVFHQGVHLRHVNSVVLDYLFASSIS